MTAPLATFVGVAHPWMCDAMGHVNVRHYAAMLYDEFSRFECRWHMNTAWTKKPRSILEANG